MIVEVIFDQIHLFNFLKGKDHQPVDGLDSTK